MIRNCDNCGESYDDAKRLTYCPHKLLMPVKDMERKDLAISLLGKTVIFNHEDSTSPGRTIISVSHDGMVELGGMSGLFAPSLFKVKQVKQ